MVKDYDSSMIYITLYGKIAVPKYSSVNRTSFKKDKHLSDYNNLSKKSEKDLWRNHKPPPKQMKWPISEMEIDNIAIDELLKHHRTLWSVNIFKRNWMKTVITFTDIILKFFTTVHDLHTPSAWMFLLNSQMGQVNQAALFM